MKLRDSMCAPRKTLKSREGSGLDDQKDRESAVQTVTLDGRNTKKEPQPVETNPFRLNEDKSYASQFKEDELDIELRNYQIELSSNSSEDEKKHQQNPAKQMHP